jgi:hypothetical protein
MWDGSKRQRFYLPVILAARRWLNAVLVLKLGEELEWVALIMSLQLLRGGYASVDEQAMHLVIGESKRSQRRNRLD